MPTLLDRFLWKPSSPTLASTEQQTVLEKKLVQEATLSDAELMLCASRAEIEAYITAKISKKVLETQSTETSPEVIATDIEHERLLANLWWYIDNTHAPKNADDTTKDVSIQQDDCRNFFTSLIQPQKGNHALSLAQTKQINNQLQDPAMHHLFSELIKQPYGFEWFLRDSTIYGAWPEKIVEFFTALYEMATSWVSASTEKWLSNLQNLTKEKNPHLIGTRDETAHYIYQDKQISKRKE